MSTSLIVAIVIVAALLAGLIWSRRKQAHHLDGLHISSEAKGKQDPE